MLTGVTKKKPSSVFDLAHSFDSLTGPHVSALKRIFRVTGRTTTCSVGPELSAKYKVPQDNQQFLVSVTNRFTHEQTWFNEARTQKPQTFSQAGEFIDPTNGGATCDFCRWPTLTATDDGFGRIELPAAVTGSNLFKYAEPGHGVVLFKHHDPLQFSQAQLSDLLEASWRWFLESHKLHPNIPEAFLLWNCLPRAGASQYHGHAQVMLTEAPVPGIVRLQQAAAAYEQQHPGSHYHTDLLRAHAACGLLRQVSLPAAAVDGSGAAHAPGPAAFSSSSQHTAWAMPSITPIKDMEVLVLGRHICCPAFQAMLHASLRAVIDGCGCRTFNCGLLGIDLREAAPSGSLSCGPEGRLFWPSVSSSCCSALNSSNGNTGSRSGSGSNSAADGNGSSMSWSRPSSRDSTSGTAAAAGLRLAVAGSSDDQDLWIPGLDHWGPRGPVVARLVSRGKLTCVASDFGGLEVFGGASIGHTDPFAIAQQLDMQLQVAAEVAAAASASAGF